MVDCIICDIDGTIANLDHRLHHIRKQPRDYDAFYAAMLEDTPIVDTIWLIEKLMTAWFERTEYNDFKFFICTGRPENYREQTEAWLASHVTELYLVKTDLLMRPSGDTRPDAIIKDEMRQQIESQGYNIRLVLEDRQSVVDMWRANGITCLQVNQWDET